MVERNSRPLIRFSLKQASRHPSTSEGFTVGVGKRTVLNFLVRVEQAKTVLEWPQNVLQPAMYRMSSPSRGMTTIPERDRKSPCIVVESDDNEYLYTISEPVASVPFLPPRM